MNHRIVLGIEILPLEVPAHDTQLLLDGDIQHV